jgi:hypothetical protein
MNVECAQHSTNATATRLARRDTADPDHERQHLIPGRTVVGERIIVNSNIIG